MKPKPTEFLLLVLCTACVGGRLASGPPPFSQILHKAISGPSGYNTNTVFSPYSVGTALSMLRLGTTGNSRRQLRDALGRGYRTVRQQNVQAPGVTVRLFNAFYHDQSLVVYSDYVSEVKKRFAAEVETQPFAAGSEAAVNAINRRVETETLGKIKNLLTAGNDQLVSVLVSAVYMKAEWKKAFDPRITLPGRFTTCDGQRQKVMMMNAEGHYNYLKSDVMSAVALPYKDERFQMMFVLPERGANISDITNSINVAAIYKDMRFTSITLKLPKFRVKSEIDLSDTLKSMGVRDVLTSLGSLQRLSPDPRLYISQVRHSAVIETDESGSEAAAATSISISARSFLEVPKLKFSANRPFLFYIYDVSTGNVLFSGHVADALAAQAEGSPASPVATPTEAAAPPFKPRRRPTGRKFPSFRQFPARRRPSSVQNELEGRNARRGQFQGGQRHNSRQWRNWQHQQQPTSRYPAQRRKPHTTSRPGHNSRYDRMNHRASRGQFHGGEPHAPRGQTVLLIPSGGFGQMPPQQTQRRTSMPTHSGRYYPRYTPQRNSSRRQHSKIYFPE